MERKEKKVFFQDLWYRGSPVGMSRSGGRNEFHQYNTGCVGGKMWSPSVFSLSI
jgi:hypothetical protein